MGGLFPGLDMTRVAAIAGEQGKPVFLWLLGTRQKAREFHMSTQEAGIPVFRELYRAVECIAAAFQPGRNRPKARG